MISARSSEAAGFLFIFHLLSFAERVDCKRSALSFWITMKEYATQFYSSAAWQSCRKAYAKSRGNLCEKCLLKGLYTPGEIVHHKIHLTPENIELPEVTLNWDNLELVCRECHAVEHGARERRYEVLPDGRVAPR